MKQITGYIPEDTPQEYTHFMRDIGLPVGVLTSQSGWRTDNLRPHSFYLGGVYTIPRRSRGRASETIIIHERDASNQNWIYYPNNIRLKRQYRDNVNPAVPQIYFRPAYCISPLAIFFPTLNTLLMASGRTASAAAFGRCVVRALRERGHLQERRTPIANKVSVRRVVDGITYTDEISTLRTRVTLGADPECEVLDAGMSRIITPRLRDYFNAADQNHLNSDIGIDGAGGALEFRPKPALSAAALTANLAALFQRTKEPLSIIGHHTALGCHVHFGLGRSTTPPAALLMALDDFFGNALMNLSGTARGNYNRLSAYREQQHGFEYRTPSAALIAQPEIFRDVVHGMHMLVESFYSGDTIRYSDTPTKQDYIQCCGWTSGQYDNWINFRNDYSNFRNSASAYKLDAREVWASNIETIDYVALRRQQQREQERLNLESRQQQEQERQRQAQQRQEQQVIRQIEAEQLYAELLRQHLVATVGAPDTDNSYHDEWSSSVIEIFNRLIGRQGLRFFGLSEGRGNNVTYGYALEGYETISVTAMQSNNSMIGYGVPRVVRDGRADIETIELHAMAIGIHAMEQRASAESGGM